MNKKVETNENHLQNLEQVWSRLYLTKSGSYVEEKSKEKEKNRKFELERIKQNE